jgi:aspartate/methionine/tyrosine aminotransferase
MEYANRLASIQPFKVMEVLRRANELQSQGQDVIHMAVGEPDFATPEPIIRAGQDALAKGHTKYTDARGDAALRSAIANYYATDYALDISEDRIFITAGGSGALLLTTALLLNPGENLLMSDPGYPCNRHFLTAFSASAHLVPVSADTGYQLTGEMAREHWQASTRGVLLASPANPTGAVIDKQTLHQLAAVVSSKQGYLVSDEIYHGLDYSHDQLTNHKTSALHASNDAFVLNSFSKYFGMTGWRLGWLIVPDDATAQVEKLAQNLFICASSLAQHAALAAFKDDAREIMENQRVELQARRDFMVSALRGLGFDVPIVPAGAFYVYAALPEALPDSEPFTRWLLEEHHVAVTPGTDFGNHRANRFVRFSYAQKLSRLDEAMGRLAAAIGHSAC